MDIVNNYISFFGVKSYTKNLMDMYSNIQKELRKFMPLGVYHEIDMSNMEDLMVDYMELKESTIEEYNDNLNDLKDKICDYYYDEYNGMYSKNHIIYTILEYLDIAYKLYEDIDIYRYDTIFDYDYLSFRLLDGYNINYYDCLNDDIMTIDINLWDITPID